MKKQITFLFDNYSSSNSRKFYQVKKLLNPNDSIRSISITVINEAIKQGLVSWTDSVDNSNSVSIYVASNKITDAHSGWVSSGFGIKYSINNNGTIKVLSGYEPLKHDWTLSEIEELTKFEYIEGDSSKYIIALPTGLGTSVQEIFDWVGFMSSSLSIISIAGHVLCGLRNSVFDRKIRKIVEQWANNGIKYPEQLREFIDVKAEWRLSEVKKRLKLSDQYAIMLLLALGLEAKGNSWRITHSEESIKNRKKWIRNENKYRKSLEIFE